MSAYQPTTEDPLGPAQSVPNVPFRQPWLDDATPEIERPHPHARRGAPHHSSCDRSTTPRTKVSLGARGTFTEGQGHPTPGSRS